VVADRARLAEALSLLVSDASHASGPDRPLVIGTARDGSRAIVRISPITDAVRARASSLADAPASPAAPDSEAGPGAGPLILASRLIAVQGGTMSIDGDCLVLQIGGP
jgi:hypothetical protein